MKIDLHVHTIISPCSKLSIDDILDRAMAKGLDGVCITDHNSMAARHWIREGVRAGGLCVLFGMEYDTGTGDYLIFGPFEDISPGMTDIQLLETVRGAGGAAVAAHPLRAGRPAREQVFREGLCHVAETLNGRNTPVENFETRRLCREYGLIRTGGSDAHAPEELGRHATRFHMPIQSRSDLIFALNHGLCHPEENMMPEMPPLIENDMSVEIYA